MKDIAYVDGVITEIELIGFIAEVKDNEGNPAKKDGKPDLILAFKEDNGHWYRLERVDFGGRMFLELHKKDY